MILSTTFKWLGLLLLGVVLFLPAAAQINKKAEIKRVDLYVQQTDAFAKKHKNPHLIFADAADCCDQTAKADWRRFDSEKALDAFREQTETYTIAYNWQRAGKIVKSNFTLFSPSGDWAQYVYHYFRADGTLAKAQSEMRTFNGSLIVIQDFYFDRRGRLLKKQVKYLDLETNKPKKPEEGPGSLTDVEYYKTVRKLPFAGLLRKKS